MSSNVFRFNRTTGFVGIGTTNPSSLLDVAGTAVASNLSGLGTSLTGLNAANIVSGTVLTTVLPTTGVTPATYGSAASVAQVTVDAAGRVTGAANTAIVLAGSAITSGTVSAPVLPPSGVTPATYGSASAVAQLTVDAAGRVTNATNTAIALAGSAITSGTVPATVLPPSGVTPNTYGSTSTIPQISVDVYGRITSASSVALSSAYIPNMLVYTSPGTWTIPPGTTRFRVTGIGSGGTSKAGATVIWVVAYVTGQNSVSYTVGSTTPPAPPDTTITYNGVTVTANGGGNPAGTFATGGTLNLRGSSTNGMGGGSLSYYPAYGTGTYPGGAVIIEY